MNSRTNRSFTLTANLKEKCFECIGKNSDKLLDQSTTGLPEELCQMMLQYLIRRRLANEHNLSLLLKSHPLTTFHIENHAHIDPKALRIIAKYGSHIQDLSLRGCFRVTDEILLEIAKGCPALRRVDVSYCSRLTEQSIAPFVQASKHLEELHVERCSEIKGSLLIKNDSLKTLMLNVTCNFNELILDTPNLVMLDASECKSLKKIQNVTDVKLHPSKLHTVTLLRCPQLESQSVSEFLQTCDVVEDVNLFSCTTLTSKDLAAAAPHLTRLVRCNLSNCPLLDEVGVVAMSKYCKNLEHIFLSSSEKINDQAIIELTRGCKQLTTLGLAGLPLLSDQAIFAVAQNCSKNLMRIDIGDNSVITDASASELLNNCHKLISVAFAQTSLNDAAFECLQNPNVGRNILNLNLYRVNITDVTLHRIAKACKSVRALDLYKNTNVTDAGMEAVLKGLPDLMDLHIEQCVLLSDETLHHVAAHCQNLNTLDIFGCPAMTVEGLLEILANLTLKRINLPQAVNAELTKKRSQFEAREAELTNERDYAILQNLKVVSLSAERSADYF